MDNAIARPSVCRLPVCNVRAPYSGDWNFRQCVYARYKFMPTIAPKYVWRPGSARTRWGSLQRAIPQIPWLDFRGPTSQGGRGGEGREGERKGRGKGEEREKGERRGRVRHHGAPTTDSFRLLCVPCSGDTIQGRLHPNGNINIFRGWVTRILDKRGQTITWKAERVGVALIIYDFAMTKKVIAFREKISEPCQQTDTLAHGQHSRTSVISGLSCSSEYLPTPWQWHQYFLR